MDGKQQSKPGRFTIPSLDDMADSTPKPAVSSHFQDRLTKKSSESKDTNPKSTVTESNEKAVGSSKSTLLQGDTVSRVAYKGPLSGSPTRPQKNVIFVNVKQKGNPILKHIRNVPWEFSEIAIDYELGKSTCALYLSLRYHNLHPEYIHTRMDNMRRVYELKILLVQVDIKDPQHAIRELGRICILAGWTLILAWSAEEAGRYLETYKAYENKPADIIMEKTDAGYLAEATDFLTTVKSINKTDAMTLLSAFKSIAGIMQASAEELELCPGLGPSKARRLHDALREPFLKSDKRKLSAAVSEENSPQKKQDLKESSSSLTADSDI